MPWMFRGVSVAGVAIRNFGFQGFGDWCGRNVNCMVCDGLDGVCKCIHFDFFFQMSSYVC